mmetsp:Transcript_15091/g.40460  ORF Transcript_15091/g.40460 Transcript_15091/m.40460 type:complete len:608 (-) Transcript_15091:943-2766(-)
MGEMADADRVPPASAMAGLRAKPSGTLPAGAVLVEGFVSEEEEIELLRVLYDDAVGGERREDTRAEARAACAVRWETLARRRVAHFGHRFNYATRSYDDGAENGERALPDWAERLACRVAREASDAREDVSRTASSHQKYDDVDDHAAYSRYAAASDSSPSGFDQLTVNEYAPGVGLRAHVDTHSAFCGAIASVSLGSACVMEFRRSSSASRHEFSPSESSAAFERTSHVVLLPRRCLLVLGAESRYRWLHYIPLRKYDMDASGELRQRGTRVSLTLRTVRRSRLCKCRHSAICDSQQAPTPAELKSDPGVAAARRAQQKSRDVAEFEKLCALGDVEQALVARTYEAIACHFDDTRFAMWGRVRRFIEELPAMSTLIDAGCGNAVALLEHAAQSKRVALCFETDSSPALLELAALRCASAAVAAASGAKKSTFRSVSSSCMRVAWLSSDCSHIALRGGVADGVMCIAVLHHLHTQRRRLAAARELVRVLRRGGRGIVYVWALEQQHPHRTLERWTDLSSASGGQPGDYIVPWFVPLGAPMEWKARAVAMGGEWDDVDRRGVRLRRYVHLFRENELQQLIIEAADSGCVRVLQSWSEKSNHAIMFEKI